MKPDPPRPDIIGSTMFRVAAVATAASMAFPPFIKILSPAIEAKGWFEQTIPFTPMTTGLKLAAVPLIWIGKKARIANIVLIKARNTRFFLLLDNMHFPPSKNVDPVYLLNFTLLLTLVVSLLAVGQDSASEMFPTQILLLGYFSNYNNILQDHSEYVC
jgi:hypothetical protein